jgi:hypothetical protein
MSRTILIGIFAALLAAGSTRSGNAMRAPIKPIGRERVWPVPISVSTPAAAPSVSASSISTTPYGTSRTKNPSGDQGNAPSRTRCKASGLASQLRLRPPVAPPYRRASPWQ